MSGMKQLTELSSWIALEKHSESLRLTPSKIFKKNSVSRDTHLKLYSEGISIDFTKQRVNENTIQLLINLANEQNIKEKISSLIQGDKVNSSENKPALHTALRTFTEKSIFVDGRDIIPDILATREQMRLIATQIRNGL